MVDGCRNIEDTETGDLLMRDDGNKFVVQGSEKDFSYLVKKRLVRVKE